MSERFAEGFLCLEVFVALAFVKLVRALADYVGTDRHALAAVFARPFFSGGQQSRARSQATLPFANDQSVHFRANVALQERFSAHVQPANHSILLGIRDKYGVLRRRLDRPQSCADLRCGRRIPELARQHRKLRRIGALRAPDLEFVVLCETLLLAHFVFR